MLQRGALSRFPQTIHYLCGCGAGPECVLQGDYLGVAGASEHDPNSCQGCSRCCEHASARAFRLFCLRKSQG